MGYFDNSDSDDGFSADFRCRGKTKDGKRCKMNCDSMHAPARTILEHGYCTLHMSQKKPSRGVFHTSHGVYKNDKPHPPIVLAARQGRLDEVLRLLQEGVDVDSRRKRLEVEEKFGYDKEWSWDDDTALITAAREGHHEIAYHLLLHGASPTVKSCPQDDVHETADDAAKKQQKIISGKRSRDQLEKRARYDAILEMLAVAAKFPSAADRSSSTTASSSSSSTPTQHSADSLSSLKVEELKDLLRRSGQKISGKKAELLSRLQSLGPERLTSLLTADFAEKQRACEEAKRESLRVAEEKRQAATERKAQLKDALAAVKDPLPIDESEVVVEEPPAKRLRMMASPMTTSIVGTARTFGPPLSSATARTFGPPSSSTSMQFPSVVTARTLRAPSSSTTLTCGCGRTFVNLNAKRDHLANSTRCPHAAKCRR
eukprot:TRINITY_DN3955_c0_g1_i1.p1 TRINITY_DN3955_c0_g1~~TRINITY_DN3955_c0_g1_i1.p1  ORF type:complete len:429 (-),score=40.99 TRINITY_DN3955_c0_g1_i1:566-1852(-)